MGREYRRPAVHGEKCLLTSPFIGLPVTANRRAVRAEARRFVRFWVSEVDLVGGKPRNEIYGCVCEGDRERL